jgi:LacI family transcriptional regulator
VTAPARVALLVEAATGLGRGILHGIARHMSRHGRWSCFLAPTEGTTVSPGLRNWKGDGVIASIQSTAMAARLQRLAPHIVNVAGNVSVPGIPSVGSDPVRIARMAAEHFRERGFREFGYVGLRGHSFSDQRRDAFANCLAEGGLALSVVESAPGRPDWTAHRARLARWLRGRPKPVAVLGCHDIQARTLIEVCASLGFRVPDDVAVLGVDEDRVLCELSLPPLSSIDPASDLIGLEAARLLERLMAGEPVGSRSILVPPRGVVTRQSTEIMAVGEPLVARALDLLRADLSQPVSVRQVAERLGVSRRTLEHRFEEAIGHPPAEQLRRFRIQAAEQLLCDTDLPFAEIAERTGFRSAKSFGDIFTRQTRTTPSEFRRKLRDA